MTTETGSHAALLEGEPRGAAAGGASLVRERSDRLRRWGPALVAYLLVQGVQLLLVRHLAPRFFWFDDSQGQFGPMAWWLGQNQQGGRPPLMNPDLGMGGNVVADPQYGVLDPLHWVLQALVGRSTDFLAISWAYGATMLLVLGVGSLFLLLQHRVQPALAVAGAVGIASSGFLTWYGSSWWPLLWSTACLPWLWLGLRSRGAVGVLVTGLASWALLTSGNPYAFPFAGLIIVGQLVEYRREYGSWRRVVDVRAVSRVVACAGGLVVALPGFLATLQISSVMGRQGADPLVGNTGFAVANLGDVVLGGATLLGETNAWTGGIGLVPAMATMLVALPMAALVDWRRAWNSPGVLTAGLVWLAGVVATQLPTTVLVFRYPVRYLVYAEFALPLLVLIAVTVAPRLTRGRLVGAAAVVFAQALIAMFRAPVFVRWHLLALVLGLVALAAAVVVLRSRAAVRNPDRVADRSPDDTAAVPGPDRGDRTPARSSRTRPGGALVAVGAVVLVLFVSAGFPLGEQMMVSLQERDNVLKPGGTPTGDSPLRALDPGRELGTTVADYRAASYAPDQEMTVITWQFDPDRGWADGVVNGSGNVVAGLEPGFASLAVWQAALNERWCRGVWGATCSSPESLLAPAGDTGSSWLDLMSADTVLLSTGAPQEVRDHFAQTWTEVSADDTWLRYEREDGLPGRITAATGVTVSADGWTSGLARLDTPMDSYVVSTGDTDGTLALRVPYYPGMRATLDGADLPVTTVEDAALAVRVPAGVTSGRLAVYYDPAGASLVVPATVVGGLLIVLASASALVARRRRAA